MKLFTTKKDLLKAIDDIRTTGKKLDDMIQVAAVSTIAHLDKHGDVTLINTLVEAMPKGSRVNALRAFIEAHAKVTYDEGEKAFRYNKQGTTMLDDAISTPWTDFKPEAPYQPMDLAADIAKLIKKATERAADAKDSDKIDPELLAKLSGLVAPEVAH